MSGEQALALEAFKRLDKYFRGHCRCEPSDAFYPCVHCRDMLEIGAALAVKPQDDRLHDLCPTCDQLAPVEDIKKPPMPSEVREAVKYFKGQVDYAEELGNSYVDCIETNEIKTLITAVEKAYGGEG